MQRSAIAAVAALIILGSIVAYFPVRGSGFIQDDHPILELNPIVHRGDVVEVLTTDWWGGVGGGDPYLYRPATMLSFVLERGSDDRVDPARSHRINVALHILCAGLLVALTLRLGVSAWASAGAGLLFAAHPVHVSAVAGLVGRAEILVLLFTLAALLAASAAMPWNATPTPRWADRPATAAWIAGLFTLLALASKETGIATPAMLGALALLYGRSRSGDRNSTWVSVVRPLVPTALATLGYLAMRTAVLGRLLSTQDPRLSDNPLVALDGLERASTALAVAGRYAILLLWPARLSADYSGKVVAAESSLLAPLPVLGLVFLCSLVVIAVPAFRTRLRILVEDPEGRASSFAAAAFLLPYLVVGNLVVLVGVVMAERLIYVPSAGICVLLAILVVAAVGAVGRLASCPRAVLAAILAVAFTVPTVAGVWRTHLEARNWKNEETLFSAVVAATPNNPRAHFTLGMIALERGETDVALERFARTLELWPQFSAAWFETGRIQADRGRFEDAANSFARAAEINPNHLDAQRMYGQALHRLGRLDEAAAALETALRARQVSPAAVAEYGHVLMKLGRHAEAASAYRQAIAMGREDLTANLERAERGAAGEGNR